MSSLQPIILYGHRGTPNPVKVQIVLEELGLPYTTKSVELVDMKLEPYLSINPNGKVPSIEDPNTGVTMFESGAIVQYLCDEYDRDSLLTYTDNPEKAMVKSWLHFQTSGQGPMYGQLGWFMRFHAEPVPSAIERYSGEVRRVLGVIERHLGTTGNDYLVGDKATVADLAYLPWNHALPWLLGEKFTWEAEFPKSFAWHGRLVQREKVRKVLLQKDVRK